MACVPPNADIVSGNASVGNRKQKFCRLSDDGIVRFFFFLYLLKIISRSKVITFFIGHT